MEHAEYAVRLSEVADGVGFTCRDVSEVRGKARTREEALEMAAELLEELLYAYMSHLRVIPRPSGARQGEYVLELSDKIKTEVNQYRGRTGKT